MAKPAVRDLLWFASGALLLGAVVVSFTLAYDDRPAAEQVAAQARSLELVDGMRAQLAVASDEAQGAVMAVTDEESAALAESARAATAAVDSQRAQLATLLQANGREPERERLADFGQAFDAFRALDAELLDLAVRNTNLKAYALAYGPAARAVDELGEALAALLPPDGATDARIAALALGARVAALRIQTLLAPHVAEGSEARMDELEAHMGELGEEVRRDLESLRGVVPPGGADRLAAADEAWARFLQVQGQVVALSRENTNVRSLALALDRKRKLVSACAAALDSLRQAIADEAAPGPTHGPPPKPR